VTDSRLRQVIPSLCAPPMTSMWSVTAIC